MAASTKASATPWLPERSARRAISASRAGSARRAIPARFAAVPDVPFEPVWAWSVQGHRNPAGLVKSDVRAKPARPPKGIASDALFPVALERGDPWLTHYLPAWDMRPSASIL